MNNNIMKSFDIRKYYRIVMRRKSATIIPFITIVFISVLFALLQKPVYESSTTILVGKPNLTSENLNRITVRVNRTERLDVLRKVILGQKNLSELITRLNLKDNPKLRKKAQAIHQEYPDLTIDEIMEKLLIEKLKKQIKITTSRDNFITIKAKSNDRDKVYLLVKTLAELFMNQVIGDEYENIKQIIEFSAQQLKIYEEKLKKSEAKLREFERLMAKNPTKTSSNISSKAQLGQYRSLLKALDVEISQKRNELDRIEGQLKDKNYYYRFPIKKNLKNLESQYIMTGDKLFQEVLQFSLKDANAVKLNERIGMLRRQMIGEIRKTVRSELGIEDDELFQLVVLNEVTKRDLALLKKKQKGLLGIIKKYNVEIAQKPFQEVTLTKLKREVETNREIYNTFLRQAQGSFIAEALQRQEADYKFKIIEPAIKPMERANSRKKVVIIGTLIAAMISFIILGLIEILDDSFTEIEEIVEYLNLPVLGTVPRIAYLNRSNHRVALLILIILTVLLSLFIR